MVKREKEESIFHSRPFLHHSYDNYKYSFFLEAF